MGTCIQNSVDDGIPGNGLPGRQPSLVDMGSRGCVPESSQRTETGDEGLCEKATQADR